MHTGVISGEYGGDGFTALALPATSGTGTTPSIKKLSVMQEWCWCRRQDLFHGCDHHTLATYQSPNGGDAIATLCQPECDGDGEGWPDADAQSRRSTGDRQCLQRRRRASSVERRASSVERRDVHLVSWSWPLPCRPSWSRRRSAAQVVRPARRVKSSCPL